MSLLKETKIFLVLFLFLALVMHFNAWISHPIEHIEALPSSPMGVWHPLWLTAIVYGMVLVVRLMILLFKKARKQTRSG